jgi:hypothetical protein
MDRETTTVPKCQIGFITFLVLPLYTEVRKLLGDDCQVCLDELNRNLAAWQSEGDALVADWDLAAPAGVSLGFPQQPGAR